ncbi:aspartate/glutamate racemase family protein [Pseudonocardia sp. MH-G8]|uniref:aspartate/glutamate racemase family protein n=1 Tax=Pseudonocardia sp. MH-G8 TaxID=1854588 RepID=UPI000BA097BA|nr:aspartate/glutamate racemase family protein [Pseudonocardia sp. MH-G8]OZM77968.1 hydantoin racemase [Pseudonocardia sp. MH-G8]
MSTPVIGVVRVLSTTDPDALQAHGRELQAALAVRTIDRCIPDQPHGVHDEPTHRTAAPKVAELAAELVRDGADAVMISCAADPGLAEARAVVDVPVIGAGSATAALAAALGTRVGVLGILDEPPEPYRLALGERIVGTVAPRGVARATELYTPEGAAGSLRASDDLVAAGADVIAFACTGLTSLGLAQQIRDRHGVVVVDPVLAAGHAVCAALGH